MAVEVFKRCRNVGAQKTDLIYSTFNYNTITKEMLDFSIVQVFGENKTEIIKYDSAHGKVHVHKYYTKENLIEDLDLSLSVETYRFCLNDVITNWARYKEKYLKKQIFNNT